MLAIQSRDTTGNSLTKYAIISGALFLTLQFVFHNYFVMISSCYVAAFILMFVWMAGKRQVKMLKVQAKGLDVYFGGFRNTEIKSFQLTDLQGRYFNAKTLFGKSYSVLEITYDNATVCAVGTREGFEEGRLKELFLLLNQIK